ncbi:HAMP domain-containing sensor histidine kinase [Enterocloster bolteae]|uniref:sensor histidine kinase n=1 Tax=Enterocloster bolteae TaxID=208479 RepID=UPI0028DC2059|nr:HAMP domain-containing sensor histidine kinase [Enterocloster bolteae]
MTIKKKIRLSNILMVLIPILVTAFALAVCMTTSLGSYWYSLETMYKDENGIQSAQSLIYTYQKELWEINWGEECKKKAEEPIRQNDTMYHLERKLSNMGYHILVNKNGNQLYSNISDEDIRAAEEISGVALESADVVSISSENISVIKNTFSHEGKRFFIIAVNNGRGNEETESYLQNYILKYMVIILGVFFVMMVLVNGVLSYWVSRSVLIPLKKLGDGTREITNGNLDTNLDYHKPDEFGEVCHDFEEMREYLKQSVQQRLEYETRRKEIISGVSHDLRTPLTSISGYLDGLMEGIADTPEKRKRYFNAIKTRTRDLERLVDSLSEYNRLESGKVKYHMERRDFKQFIEHYLSSCQEENVRNHVTVTFECAERVCLISFDKDEMKRVFDNLFSNTVRYRERSESEVLIRLNRISGETWLQITFRDNGPGVPEESLKSIFETFFRVDDARSEAGKGSGIGLAVVKEIITGHGGTVHAENHSGLSVVIRLPAAKEETESGTSSDH